MINYGYITRDNIKKHNPNWPRILDHPYRILIFGGSASRKTNTLIHLIKQQDDDDYIVIDKIYLYDKDPNEASY